METGAEARESLAVLDTPLFSSPCRVPRRVNGAGGRLLGKVIHSDGEMSLSPAQYKIQKRCPQGHWLVVRKNRETGGEFLGCSRWPECVYAEPLPEDIKMRRAGAQVLPGFKEEK
mgnify:CR=1 FL=1